MSNTEAQQAKPRSNFASRMLTKELNIRQKPSKEIKISPADAAKYAVADEAKKEEKVTV